MTLEELPEVLTVRELSQLLRLDEDTCYEMVRDGRMPAIRIRRRILILKEEVRQWMQRELQAAAQADRSDGEWR